MSPATPSGRLLDRFTTPGEHWLVSTRLWVTCTVLRLVIGRRPHLPGVCELAEVVSCPGDVHVARQADRLALVLALGPRQLLPLAVYQLSDPSQAQLSQTVLKHTSQCSRT